MAGTKDFAKRSLVRKLLKTKRGREMSDREAGRELGYSRALVTAVRLELIAAGLHPPVTGRKYAGDREIYRPGASARGGYVHNGQGQIIRDSLWKSRQRSGSGHSRA